jgi:hypothetical protein
MHPTTPSTRCLRRCLSAASSWARAITRSSAFSRTAHVLMRMTSALAASVATP